MFAPRLFMVLMDRRNGVALGTTSTKNQIRWRPWIKGICKCLKLYSTGLLPKRKPVLLGCSRTICRMLAGNFRRTAGTWSLPVTLRLAPVSMIAMPVVVTVLAAIWVVLHSATSLMLETFGSLANVNGLGGSWDTTVEWGLIWFGDCWALSPYLVIPISIFLFAYTTGPKLYGLMLDGVSGAGRMFGERWKTHLWHPPGLEVLLDDHLGLAMRAKLLHMFTGCISLVRALCFPVPQHTFRTHCKRLIRAKSSSLAPLPPPLQPPREKPLPRDFDGQKPLDLFLSLILCRASSYDASTLCKSGMLYIISSNSLSNCCTTRASSSPAWTSESRASAVSTSSSSCDTW